jgi:hypothetical protein
VRDGIRTITRGPPEPALFPPGEVVREVVDQRRPPRGANLSILDRQITRRMNSHYFHFRSHGSAELRSYAMGRAGRRARA